MECYCCAADISDNTACFDVWYHKNVCQKCNDRHVKAIMAELVEFKKIVYPYRYSISKCAKCGTPIFDEWGYSPTYDVYLCIDC